MKIVCSKCHLKIKVRLTTLCASNGAKIFFDHKGRKISGSVCKDCKLKQQREYRKKSKNLHTKSYEKTRKGFLMRVYRNMKSRIQGIQKKKRHLYEGKFLLSKKKFYLWAEYHPTFLFFFEQYKKSNFQRKLAPSVDRINSNKGYLLSNMEWVTHSENSRRGSRKTPRPTPASAKNHRN